MKRANQTGGVGYGGDARQDQKKRNAGMKKAAQEENKRVTEQLSFLNKSQKIMKANKEAPDAQLLSTIREVLRNQVPNEWGKRRTLYESALECCQLIAVHHPKALGASDDDESVMAALEEFAQHAELISTHEQTSSATDKAFVAKILQVRKDAATASKAVLERPEMSIMDSHEYYRQALRPLRFEFVETMNGHTYANKPQSTQDPRKLFRELTTYKTALPIEYGSSIFVRALENRLDLLRVCITGPEDTPYANGAFVFDMYLGDYPRKPPQVKYLTTGGGRHRFNPNLYNDGKVCLSLLGTWKGPGWVSGESTILQILISIQSLILVNDPYFNEPGYDRIRGTPAGKIQSDGYNFNIRNFTTEVCILPFLTQPCPYPEFDEAMQRHFRNKRSDLQKQLFQWYRDNELFQNLYMQCLDILEGDRATKRKGRSVAAVLPPQKEIKTTVHGNGVIEIESDHDETTIVARKAKRTNNTDAGDAIIIVDDEDDAKPAARIIDVDSRQNEHTLYVAISDNVVDLT